MEKVVPAGAAILLDFIHMPEIESHRASYDRICANMQQRGARQT